MVTSDPRIADDSNVYVTPHASRWTPETLSSSCHEWGSERTAVLLGDVVYSKNGMDATLSSRADAEFFLTKKGRVTELVAASFSAMAYPEVHEACRRAVARAEASRGEVRMFTVLGLMTSAKRTSLDDWTTDFDCESDYIAFNQDVLDDLRSVTLG